MTAKSENGHLLLSGNCDIPHDDKEENTMELGLSKWIKRIVEIADLPRRLLSSLSIIIPDSISSPNLAAGLLKGPFWVNFQTLLLLHFRV